MTIISVTLKKTQTEPQKYIIIFNETNTFESVDKIKKSVKKWVFFYFPENYSRREWKNLV